MSDERAEAARLRDGRTTDTRERVLRVVEQLYLAGGYERINLHTIAQQVGVSKAALFHHFRNKQDLFYAMLIAMLARYSALFAEARDAIGEDARARLRHIMWGLTQQEPFDMARFVREEYGLLSPEQRTEIEHAWRAGLFDAVHQILERGARAGEVRAPDLTLATYVFMHLCMLLPRSGNPAPEALTAPRDESATLRAIDALLDMFLDGVGVRPTDDASADAKP
jgi:AcrR family transcriptional regulator